MDRWQEIAIGQLQSPARPDPIPTEPDFIITMTTQGQDEATLDRALLLKLDVLGRAQCGFNDTEGVHTLCTWVTAALSPSSNP